MEGNLFEKASRCVLRFSTAKGLLAVEDLWLLPLTSKTGNVNLDDIARELHREVRETDGEVSFVTPAQGPDETLSLSFELIKYIIKVRVAERDAAAEAMARKEKKQRLLELIAKKEDETLAGKPLEELRAMVEGL